MPLEINEVRDFKRQKVQEETLLNIRKNADMMKQKFEKHRKRSVLQFNVGDRVVLHVKKDDRRNATLRNIPCVIINISMRGTQPQYRLLCEAGVISKMVNGSMLNSFPGEVRTGDPDYKISIREAAR